MFEEEEEEWNEEEEDENWEEEWPVKKATKNLLSK